MTQQFTFEYGGEVRCFENACIELLHVYRVENLQSLVSFWKDNILFLFFFFSNSEHPNSYGQKKKKLSFKTSVSGFNSICRKINFILEIYQINEMLKWKKKKSMLTTWENTR